MGKTCKALFDFKARKAEELSLTKGETLENVGKVSDEWWKGRNKDGKVGVFPANYVVIIDLDKVLKTVVARYDFEANKPDRISFKKGERIAVLAEVSADWWTGKNAAGDTGLFPSNYVAEEEVLAARSKANRSNGDDEPSSNSGSSVGTASRRTGSAAPAVTGKSSGDGAKTTFTSATLKDFPIQFKMPSQAVPSLKIGGSDDSTARTARNDAKAKLAELNSLLS